MVQYAGVVEHIISAGGGVVETHNDGYVNNRTTRTIKNENNSIHRDTHYGFQGIPSKYYGSNVAVRMSRAQTCHEYKNIAISN